MSCDFSAAREINNLVTVVLLYAYTQQKESVLNKLGSYGTTKTHNRCIKVTTQAFDLYFIIRKGPHTTCKDDRPSLGRKPRIMYPNSFKYGQAGIWLGHLTCVICGFELAQH